jgi:hypothetical protein
MKSPRLFTALGIAACGITSATAAVPAFADNTPDCGSAQAGAVISVVAGNCEAIYSVAGDYSFERPANAQLVNVLLVGAGGGATVSSGYGDGGGEVLFVDFTEVLSTVEFSVGAGGGGGNETGGGGGDTSFGMPLAQGGQGALWTRSAGSSGDGHSALNSSTGGGSIDDGQGNGYLPSDPELVDDNGLFPVINSELELGRGGRFEAFPTEIGFGWGGYSWLSTAQSGSDGAVIVRWTTEDLASTGYNGTALALASLGALALGTTAVLSTRRRRAQ